MLPLSNKIAYNFFKTLLCFLLIGFLQNAEAQERDSISPLIKTDSLTKVATALNNKTVDSVMKEHSPRRAAIQSAIIPGWGQIYNGKYWKLPLVYGALGTSGYIFFYNLKSYRDTRFAYKAKFKAALPPYDPTKPGPFRDSTDYFKINPRLSAYSLETLRYNRDEFRRYVDYSTLIFMLLWGLNVIDASVDAHLKTFDVSPDLSLKFKPGYSEIARTGGISIILAFK